MNAVSMTELYYFCITEKCVGVLFSLMAKIKCKIPN